MVLSESLQSNMDRIKKLNLELKTKRVDEKNER